MDGCPGEGELGVTDPVFQRKPLGVLRRHRTRKQRADQSIVPYSLAEAPLRSTARPLHPRVVPLKNKGKGKNVPSLEVLRMKHHLNML